MQGKVKMRVSGGMQEAAASAAAKFKTRTYTHPSCANGTSLFYLFSLVPRGCYMGNNALAWHWCTHARAARRMLSAPASCCARESATLIECSLASLTHCCSPRRSALASVRTLS